MTPKKKVTRNVKVFRVAPQKEFYAEALLQGQGAQAVVPYEWRTERCGSSRSRRRRVKRPLLNGYVLSTKAPIRTDERDAIIKGCIGHVTNEETDRLHATLIERSTPPPPAIAHEWKKGDLALMEMAGIKCKVRLTTVSRKGTVMVEVVELPPNAKSSGVIAVGRSWMGHVEHLGNVE